MHRFFHARLARFLAALCLLLAISSSAHGWNYAGHMIVAEITWRKLSPSQRESVSAILKRHPHYATLLTKGKPAGVDVDEWAFLRAATWPDLVRPPRGFPADEVATHAVYRFHRGPWHYVDYPYTAGEPITATMPAPLPAPTDILRQLPLSIEVVRGKTDDPGRLPDVDDAANRAVRLCWLLHLVGDLHQPLHTTALVDSRKFPAGHHDDQGGNLIAVRAAADEEPTRLHSYWDGLLGSDSRYTSVTALANGLLDDPSFAPGMLAELPHTTIAQWTRESYEQAIETVYLRGELPVVSWDDFADRKIAADDVPVLPREAQQHAREVARRRVLLAGLRIAALLAEPAEDGREASKQSSNDDRETPAVEKVRVALIGDSTVASYPRPPADRPDLTGWGQVFGEYFTDRVEVLNHAASGRSSKSFLAEGRWQPVLKEKPDFVFIQFGHNDQPGKGNRTTDPHGDFQDNLKRYIREAREAGAVPVLVTPVARRTFRDGKPYTTLTPYAEAMQQVGRETKTPVVDLHAAAFALYEKLGDEGSADLSASATDRTHFSRKGGLAMAGLVADALPKAVPELATLLKSTPAKEDVFTAGEGGYAFYRIPSMVATPGGALLVFCEGRKSDRSDDGDIDLLLRRSNNGRKWLDVQLVHEEGGDAPIKFGNPCAVVDRETGVIWLTMNRSTGDARSERHGGEIFVTHSDDHGATWSTPVDITAQVKRPEWRHYALGPGVGIQLTHGPHKGRLIVPANYRTSFNNREPSYSHVIYSDDHGRSWQLGGIVGPHTNECQLVETFEHGESGLLFNMRNHWGRSGGKPELAGKRLVSRSRDDGATWSEATVDETLIEPTCQASLLRYSFADDGKGEKSRILFANPASKSRDHLTVRVSYDEGRTWPVSKLIDAGPSAYSCMARLSDGRIALVYERDDYRRLTYTALSIEWLEGDE